MSPNLNQESIIEIAVPDLCRSIKMIPRHFDEKIILHILRRILHTYLSNLHHLLIYKINRYQLEA